MSQNPESIKIDDIASGKIQPEEIYAELDRLKVEINVLRNNLSLFLKTLATIPETQSQQQYYNNLVQRVSEVRSSIKEFGAQYDRLLPIINFTQIKLGQEVETSNSAANGSPTKVMKKTPV